MDKKISALDPVDLGQMVGTELIPIVSPVNVPRSNKKITVSQLMTFAPVQSVNGFDGEVTLSAGDVGAVAPGENLSVFTNDVGYIISISGIAAGGDLSGTYPNPSIANNAVVTAKILNANVTYGKIQNVTQGRLLGRYIASDGVVQEIQIGTNLSLNTSTGVLSAIAAALTDGNGTTASGSAVNLGGTLSQAVGIATDTNAFGISGNGTITLASGARQIVIDVNNGIKMDLSSDAVGDIYYRSAGGYVVRRAIGATDRVLMVSGGLPVWGTVNTGGVSDAAVTYAKIQNVTQAKLLGRYTASDGVLQEVTIGGNLTLNASTGVLSSGIFSLSSGSGTTVNGTAVDLGGALTSNASITGGFAITLGNAASTGAGFGLTAAGVTYSTTAYFRVTPTGGTTSVTSAPGSSIMQIGGSPAFAANNSILNSLLISTSIGSGGRTGTIYRGIYYNPTLSGSPLSTHYAIVLESGLSGFGVSSPTARLHLAAGTATVNTAPLKFNTGVALTTPEDGAFEYHTSHLYFTIGSTRYQIDQQSGGGGTPGGSTTQIQYNSLSTFAGDATYTFNSTLKRVMMTRALLTPGSSDPSSPSAGELTYNSTVVDFRAYVDTQWVNITRPGSVSTKSANFSIQEVERNTITYVNTAGGDIIIDLSGTLMSTHWVQTFVNTGTGAFAFNIGSNTLNAIANYCAVRYGAVTLVHQGAGVYFAFGALGEGDSGSDSGSGGAVLFTDLLDVPPNYSGSALKFVRVNTAATGLEFVSIINGNGTTVNNNQVNLGGSLSADTTVTTTSRTLSFAGGNFNATSTVADFNVNTSGIELRTNSVQRMLVTSAGVWTLNLGSDALGDTYYRNSSGNLTRLAIGGANRLLGINNGGTAPEYKTVSNGITAASATLQLGGNLTGDTTIGGAFSFGVGGSPSAKFYVRGLGTTTGMAFRVDDSGSDRIFTVYDNGVQDHTATVAGNGPFGFAWSQTWTPSANTQTATGYGFYPTIIPGSFTGLSYIGIDYNPAAFSGTHYAMLIKSGNVGLRQNIPSAILHIGAGTATAGTAPLKLTTGTALTVPEDGAFEYHTSHLYFTIGSTRYQIDNSIVGSGTSTYVPYFNGTNSLTAEAAFAYNSSQNKLYVDNIGGNTLGSLLNVLSDSNVSILRIKESSTNAFLELSFASNDDTFIVGGVNSAIQPRDMIIRTVAATGTNNAPHVRLQGGNAVGAGNAGDVILTPGTNGSSVVGFVNITGKAATSEVIVASTHTLVIKVNGTQFKVLLST